ncbi:MAG: nuclear transport factor 2 family protein [Chromatiales bacterium]|nr:nuclear transport factor 2 family protein [Chromatiales bacterium]
MSRIPAARRRAGHMVVILWAAMLAACGQLPRQTASELNESYLQALERTARAMHTFEAGDPAEQGALARLAGYFGQLDEATVRRDTSSLYAAEAYLNDNLTAVQGVDAIEAYFLHAASAVEAMSVEFLDVARSGPEYYLRWRMVITARGLNRGQPVISFGVTHFRFDSEGRVLLHKDFWDAGTGLYEFLPGVGGLVRRVRGAAGGGL